MTIKEFILDNLLRCGTKAEWSCSSSRGQLALQRWMPGSTLHKSIGSVDFPTSVLIWHIATDICYYIGSGGGGGSSTSTATTGTSSSDQVEKRKEMSRQLSNYIMHLIFKCGVMLTRKSQLLHDEVRDEITEIIKDDRGGEIKDAVVKLFKANKEKKQSAAVDAADQKAGSKGSREPVELLQRAEAALYYSVMPHACEVAQVLIYGIDGEARRWGLVADVWAEMLYYIAPRAGAAFHYEHLSSGGEFITHLLYLMCILGPFLPIDGANSSSAP